MDDSTTTPDAAQDVAPVSTTSEPEQLPVDDQVVDEQLDPELVPRDESIETLPSGLTVHRNVPGAAIPAQVDDDAQLVPAYAVYDNSELRFVSDVTTDETVAVRMLNELHEHPHIGGHDLIVVAV